jgi:hypothetical protein
MIKKTTGIVTIIAFLVVLALISLLLVIPKDFLQPKKNNFSRTRHIVPSLASTDYGFVMSQAEQLAAEDTEKMKVSLEDGEIAIASLSEDFDGDGIAEQVIMYRNLLEENNPLYITYIDEGKEKNTYKRMVSAPTAATRPGTATLFTQDLIGDRNNCIIVSGMNGKGEWTMTIFRINKSADSERDILDRIAEIKNGGAITIIETSRTQAYQLGMTNGASFDITARGRDPASSNTLDLIEITYSYDPSRGRYVQNRVNNIPGKQIEAARLRELLNGKVSEFEQFIDGLWYHTGQDGSINNDQYIYFDPYYREIIFYDENTQQVYKWHTSTATRFGLYISSQNISVTTLRRIMDIELESLDSIRVKVFEDVHMKIGLSAPWDGSYRKAVSAKPAAAKDAIPAFVDAVYRSPLGEIGFSRDGTYTINLHNLAQQGRYAFFMLDGQEYLELLPENDSNQNRETYRVERAEPDSGFSLQHVRLGTRGVQDFQEAKIIFSPADKNASG